MLPQRPLSLSLSPTTLATAATISSTRIRRALSRSRIPTPGRPPPERTPCCLSRTFRSPSVAGHARRHRDHRRRRDQHSCCARRGLLPFGDAGAVAGAAGGDPARSATCRVRLAMGGQRRRRHRRRLGGRGSSVKVALGALQQGCAIVLAQVRNGNHKRQGVMYSSSSSGFRNLRHL